MAYRLSSPRFSFIQFDETDNISDCEYKTTQMCLPAYDEDDAWFQFFIDADTVDEANDLCVLSAGDIVKIGIIENCGDGYLLEFPQSPTQYRINETRVLYVWQQGLPGFKTVIDIGKCFRLMVSMPSLSAETWCTNCFQRIFDSCHTSVIEYSNNENAFGFNYCAGGDTGDISGDCEPTIIQFTNQATMTIVWTAFFQAKYGNTPNIQVWTYDENGELVIMGQRVALDAYPPNEIRIDFGGVSSGVIKIM